MGLFRFLRKWKEKADGTLTGPALETESVKTEEQSIGGVDVAPAVSQTEPGTDAQETTLQPDSRAVPRKVRGLRQGARWNGPQLLRDDDPGYSTTSTSLEFTDIIRVPPIDYPPGTVPVLLLTVEAQSDTAGEGGKLLATYPAGAGLGVNNRERGVEDQNIGTDLKVMNKEFMLFDNLAQNDGESVTASYKKYPRIKIEISSTSSSATFTINHVSVALYYEVL